MMNIFIMDLCAIFASAIDREKFNCIDDVRNAEPMIGLSEDMTKKQQSLKAIFKRSALSAPQSAGHDRQCP